VAGLLVRLAASGAPIDRVLSAEDAAARGGCPGASFVVALRPRASGPASAPPGKDGAHREGGHGYLPEHPDMDAAFLIAGPEVPAARDLGRIHMEDVAPTLAGRLGLSLRDAEGRDLLGRRAAVADSRQ
jgi:hypothetical protein